ncbi:PREDICTED: homocysteine S-methyltransferase 1-like isoform X2 [Nicrophorus vespilloides]|uniref:Homocysteine S-methyltransferase 1-like isoform X2 n=1 Tax=Nicrophorus vespilloides TaxID=110193 RepID=A0ABM1N2E8_NICVS|nr:PREDICTED: homocysteine S-methyltransferase 1-like isoform X2 [Nicrophorus vespilloides]
MPPGNGSSTACKQDSEDYQTIKLLDGGFASQLSCHVRNQIDGDVLWSARFLSTDPEAVIRTHLDFLIAGSNIIETNTYQASIGGFKEHLNLTEEESYALIKEAVYLAKSALERFKKEYIPVADYAKFNNDRPLIVGSVGPYGASLHDASEYSGSYAKTTPVQTMRDWHRPRIAALVEAGVDMLALETIPCKAEAEMLVQLIKEFPSVKAWLAFSCGQDGKSTAYGENFQQTAKKCYEMNPQQLVAVGANCLAPRLVESLFTGINKGRENRPIPLIVYPNSGESYNVEQGWIDREKCEPVETYIHKWLDLGVKYIGGCCRTYAADVTRIGNEVRKWQFMQQERQINGVN